MLVLQSLSCLHRIGVGTVHFQGKVLGLWNLLPFFIGPGFANVQSMLQDLYISPGLFGGDELSVNGWSGGDLKSD